MIRLPSFFKRKTLADDLELGSVGARRITRKGTPKVTPRSFQRSVEADELALTEDPEQQRARHRLIGVAVLVLIAVIGLPRILDNKPKSVTNDIAVNIVTSLPTPSLGTKPEEKSKIEEKSKPEAPADVVKVTPVPAHEPKADTKVDAGLEPKAEAKSEPKLSTPTTSKSAVMGLAAGEEVVAPLSAKPKTEDLSKTTGSGKYVIQIGAFASEERAKGWIAKLKEQKIPNYVLNKTGSDGIKLYVLRAGPFTDKDAAEAAEKKIKDMGLSPRLVETGKQ